MRLLSRPSSLAFLVAIAATVGLYWPGLNGGFLFDDYPNIVNNPVVHVATLSPTMLSDIWSVGTVLDTRPLSMLSFALNYYFTGLDPVAFKAVNLAIHLLNGLLIFVLMRAIVRSAAHDNAKWLPIWVTAAWLLHPINLTAVLLTVQRMAELAALFTLAGLWLYMHIRSQPSQTWPRLLAGGLVISALWLLGILAKPTAALAPLFVVLLEVFVLRRSGPSGAAMDRFGKIIVTLILTLCLIGFIYMVHAGYFSSGAYSYRNFGLTERLMTEARVVWFYVQLIVLPKLSAFALFHDDIPISRGWFAPTSTLLASVAWLAVVLVLWKWGRRIPLIGFGVAWFMVGHLLESTGLALELVHEHRNYLPSMGLILVFGEGARHLWVRRLAVSLPKLAMPFALAPLLMLALFTGMRAHLYGDEARRATVEAAYHPQSALLQFEAGITLIDLAGEKMAELPKVAEQANAYLVRAAQIDPAFKHPYIQQLNLACVMGKNPDPSIERELAKHWRTGPLSIPDRAALSHLVESAITGRNCMSARALQIQLEAVLANPAVQSYDRAMVLVKLSNMAASMNNDIPAALSYLRKALENNGASSIRLQYAMTLFRAGDLARAREELARAQAAKQFREDWEPAVAREFEQTLRKAQPLKTH